MIKYKKIIQIFVIIFFSFSIISCSSGASNNPSDNTNQNSISTKTHTWGKDVPKGPYFRHKHDWITRDKTQSKNYSPEVIPEKIDLSNTFTNHPVIIDGVKYLPIKKQLKIKWKKKNELRFYSSNKDLVESSKFFRDIFGFKEVKTPNDISFEGDLINNFRKIKVDGKDVIPTKAEYWSHKASEVYELDGKYYSDRDDLIKKNLKTKNGKKNYSSIEEMNIKKLINPRFNSQDIKIDGHLLVHSDISSKIYFKNMNLKYQLNYLTKTGEVWQFFTSYKNLILDQNLKLKTIHNFELVNTFPNDLSALKDLKNKFLLNGVKQTSLFSWNNLPANFYLLKGKKREENIFTTNYKMAEGYIPEVATQIQLPDPSSPNAPHHINIDQKHFKKIKLS